MLKNIVTPQEAGAFLFKAITVAGFCTTLVAGERFALSRRGKWLLVRDRNTSIPYLIPLEVYQSNGRGGRKLPRYRVLGSHLLSIPGMLEELHGTGLLIGNKSAVEGTGYIYLNRLVAAIGRLYERDGFESLVWQQGKWAKGRVVHHLNENTLDDRAENLKVMLHPEHDRLHDLQVLRAKRAAWLIPASPHIFRAPKRATSTVLVAVNTFAPSRRLTLRQELSGQRPISLVQEATLSVPYDSVQVSDTVTNTIEAAPSALIQVIVPTNRISTVTKGLLPVMGPQKAPADESDKARYPVPARFNGDRLFCFPHQPTRDETHQRGPPCPELFAVNRCYRPQILAPAACASPLTLANHAFPLGTFAKTVYWPGRRLLCVGATHADPV